MPPPPLGLLAAAPTFAACAALFLAWYAACRACERRSGDASRRRRERAWYLTSLISFYFGWVLGPLYAARLLLALRAGAPAVAAFLTTETALGRSAAAAMATFLVADLAVGVLEYREHIHFSTGWAHHSLYAVLYVQLISMGGTNFALAGACCEMPTFLMALGTIFPSQRRDLAFGATFFVTRIVWFAVLFAVYAQPAYNSFLPATLFAPPLVAALAMHLFWFRAWLVSQGKRAKVERE
jgi:hypothetical protein